MSDHMYPASRIAKNVAFFEPDLWAFTTNLTDSAFILDRKHEYLRQFVMRSTLKYTHYLDSFYFVVFRVMIILMSLITVVFNILITLVVDAFACDGNENNDNLGNVYVDSTDNNDVTVLQILFKLINM